MTLTEFQTKKLLHLFRTFFDTDHNGTVEKADFDLVGDKICRLRGWPVGSAEFVAAHQRLLAVWDGISVHDTDQDGHISEDEWLTLWADIIQQKKKDGWISDYLDFIFDAQDTSRDGNVDGEEFAALYVCLGMPATQCKEAFTKLTAGGNGIVTKEIFQNRFQEFIGSDDKTAAGNYLFGCGNF